MLDVVTGCKLIGSIWRFIRCVMATSFVVVVEFNFFCVSVECDFALVCSISKDWTYLSFVIVVRCCPSLSSSSFALSSILDETREDRKTTVAVGLFCTTTDSVALAS